MVITDINIDLSGKRISTEELPMADGSQLTGEQAEEPMSSSR